MSTKTRRFISSLIAVFVLVAIVVVDQWTKVFAQGRDLVVLNHGGVFGLFPGKWWVVVLSLVWASLLWEWRKLTGLKWWGMGLIVMGGFGNLVDRFYFGAVRDFIYYPWLGFYGNVADIVLAVGVLILIGLSIKKDGEYAR